MDSPAPKRRRRRTTTAVKTRKPRVPRTGAIPMVNAMVTELLKENRALKKELEKLKTRTARKAESATEKAFMALQERLGKALNPQASAPRKRLARAAADPNRPKRAYTRRPRVEAPADSSSESQAVEA